MYKRLLIISIFLSIAFTSTLKAQEYQGIIFEMSKENRKIPLPGVNIYWSGTQSGTTSGLKGDFSIENKQHKHHLIFSYVGYRNDTIDIREFDAGHKLHITLSVNKTLKEVEVKSVRKGNAISRLSAIQTQHINQNEFRKAACCNLSESFETNASVDVSYSDAVTGAKQIRLLGLAGTYSQKQIENIPNLRGLATAYGLEYIPGSWMESIQVSKGTSSVKNGYESITGQINVEYKKPHNSEKLYLNAYGNDLGKLEANFNTAFSLNDKLSTMLLGHAENMFGEIDRNGDSFLDVPKVRQYHFMNRWKYEQPGSFHGQFGLDILDEDRTAGQTSFKPELARDTNNGYGINVKTKRYQVFTKSGFIFNRPETNIGIINSLIYHEQESFFGLNDYDATEFNYYGNFMYQSYLLNSRHNYTVGFSYVYDHYDEMLNDSAFTKKESVPGLFLEYTYEIEEKLSILAGMRTDFHNLYGTLLTPRLHLRYAPSENWIFRGSAGKGYRSPNVIAENSFLLATSKKLIVQEEPGVEEAWNFGLNLTNYTDILGKQLMVNLDFYRTEFLNQMVIDMDRDIFEINIYNLNGKSYSNSLQVEANYELIPGLDVTAAYRYNDVKITLNDELQRKPLVNRYKGLLSLTYITNNRGWQFDLTSQFNGDVRLPDTEQYPEMYRRPLKGENYTIFNAQVTKYFGQWELYLGGENLGDFTQDNPVVAADDPFGKYFDTSLVWGPIVGRKIYLGLRYALPFKEKH